MATHRRIHHAHTGWPAPITGVVASLVFAAVLAYIALLLLAHS